MKEKSSKYFITIQNQITDELEKFENIKFNSDIWEKDGQKHIQGGGGITKVLSSGNIFEQAGVNTSRVYGSLPSELAKKLIGKETSCPFFATGISLVIHPLSPLIPTTHANFRYLEVDNKRWFGGGMDLTPYYIFEEDALHFHKEIKNCCDKYDLSFYPKFKKECDDYFYLPHREECRGIGGIFFDYLGKEDPENINKYSEFVWEISKVFTKAYIPIVEKRRKLSWTEKQKEFQLIRRGRYVEFNLIYDRGTLFGLKTGGRTESILMSLPPNVHWEYNYQVEKNSEEEKTINLLKNPIEWV